MNKVQLTEGGHQKIKKEYDELIAKKRPDAIDRLQKARSMGDLSENSEYSAAKENLAFVEGRIQEIEELLKNVEIVNNEKNYNQVSLGDTVKVKLDGKEESFHIVGEYEADPLNKKLSQSSPIGKALLGKKVGETVEVETPAGKVVYQVLEIC